MTTEPMEAAAKLLRDAQERVDDPEAAQQMADALALVRATHDLGSGVTRNTGVGARSSAPGD